MALVLSGDGITSDNIASLAASKLTGQVADANAPVGSVIQVVSANISARYEITSSSFVGIGPTLSITPKDANSKVLLIWSGSVEFPGYAFFTFFRNGTNVSLSDGIVTRAGGSSGWNNMGYSYVDSPSTASAITYQLAMRANTGVIYLNDYGTSNRNQLIAMEISA